jgi:hypothetical protein
MQLPCVFVPVLFVILHRKWILFCSEDLYFYFLCVFFQQSYENPLIKSMLCVHTLTKFVRPITFKLIEQMREFAQCFDSKYKTFFCYRKLKIKFPSITCIVDTTAKWNRQFRPNGLFVVWCYRRHKASHTCN